LSRRLILGMSAAQVPVSPILRGLTFVHETLSTYLEVDGRGVASYFGRFAATTCHDPLP